MLQNGFPLHYLIQFVSPFPEEVSEKEPPTALLWVYYYLAQHYDYIGQAPLAFQYVDMAIQHTPLLIELYVLKAKLCKVSLKNKKETEVDFSACYLQVFLFVKK